MFIRTKKGKKSTSIQIVENIRKGKNIQQKVLKYIGCKENTDVSGIESLMKAAQYIKYELETETQKGLLSFEDLYTTGEVEEVSLIGTNHTENMKSQEIINISHLQEEQRVIRGVFDIYGSLYQQLSFDSFFGKKQKTRNFAQVLKNIVLARIASPKSKRASIEMLDSDYGIRIHLQSVYDMMEKIDDTFITSIQDTVFQYTKTVLNEKINVLFMDGTSLYFESQKEDNFREKGYSKDGKFHETQVALTILVTESGLPIGYKLYNGSHYEGESLKDLMEEIEKKYEINRVVLVADSGFLNEKNTKYLEEKGNAYILGARIKNTPLHLQEKILDISGYTITKKDELGNMEEGYRELEYKGKRLIVRYSQTRAVKERKEREKNIEKLKTKEGKEVTDLVSNFGYKKFLKQEGEAHISIDEKKIAKAEKWDGLHGILTNDSTLSTEEIGKYYHGLWQVEESFRINKHDLLIRPIFHWTEQKIRAHIAIAFMAFSLVRHLEYRLELSGYNYSPEIIRRELLRVQGSILFDKTNPSKKYFLPSHISEIANNIYKVIGKKWNKCVTIFS